MNELISQVPFARINTQFSAPPSVTPWENLTDRVMNPVVRAVAVAGTASGSGPTPRQVCGRPRVVHAVSLTKAFGAYRLMASAGFRVLAATASFVI